MYPVLDQYQREGYQALMKIAGIHRGAFLCDGVGLGKTFIGMMLIERLILHDRKRVALLVPKAARAPVWENSLRRYLRHVGSGDYSSLAIYNHTDLQREGDYPERLARIKEMADVFVIDEGHHFRNPGQRGELSAAVEAIEPGTTKGRIPAAEEKKPSRYWRLFDLLEGKEVYLLTATPINNDLLDFKHMIELFSRRQADYFKEAPLGIHSMDGHFREMVTHGAYRVRAPKQDEAAVAQQVCGTRGRNTDGFGHLVVESAVRPVVGSAMPHHCPYRIHSRPSHQNAFRPLMML